MQVTAKIFICPLCYSADSTKQDANEFACIVLYF